MEDRLQNAYAQRAALDLAVVQTLQGLHGHGAVNRHIGLEIEDRDLANLRTRNTGIAVSLVAPSESQRARAVEELQKAPLNWQQYDNLTRTEGGKLLPPMTTLCIGSGRKDKLRPGDILGALTGEAGIAGTQVGKIAIFDFQAYVAVERSMAKQALERLNNGKIKGKSLRVRIL